MFEVAQTPLHTLAIPSLWNEVLQLILFILELEGTREGCCSLHASAEVGDKDCGFMWNVFEATFSQNHLCQRKSSVSVNIPLYTSARAFSPASITSCVEAESKWNTFACSRNILLALNLLRDVFLMS